MSDIVELAIPVEADLVVLARLTAATVASRADFDVEEIEDLRLAVDELCVSLVDGVEAGTLHLRFVRDDDAIEVTCNYLGTGGANSSVDEDDVTDGLSARILDALVDEHGLEELEGERRAWLRKRRSRQPDE